MAVKEIQEATVKLFKKLNIMVMDNPINSAKVDAQHAEVMVVEMEVAMLNGVKRIEAAVEIVLTYLLME